MLALALVNLENSTVGLQIQVYNSTSSRFKPSRVSHLILDSQPPAESPTVNKNWIVFNGNIEKIQEQQNEND